MTNEVFIALTGVTIAIGAIVFLSICAFFTNVQRIQKKLILEYEAKHQKRKAAMASDEAIEIS